MKSIQDYTDDELMIEQNRRYERKREAERAVQKRCEHLSEDIIGHLRVIDEVDEHSGRDSILFEFEKICKKCHKQIGIVRMNTFKAENEMEFKLGLEELCRKYGRVWPK